MDFYLKNNVEENFRRIDELGSGFIEAEQVGRFIKDSCQDQTMDLY